MEALFLVGRILFGGFFVFSGINHFMKLSMMTGYAQSKKVPMPKLGVMISGILLIAGGSGILLGAYVEWASLALIVALVPISLMLHNFWTIS
ncbi:MAG: DoxX family protein, partial [Candidatus Wildermuthbacteria bacterium]|nr:DoxX family protein [Candidatus Wildermuthbacteria bacterium]